MLKFSKANNKIRSLSLVTAIQPYLEKRKIFSLDLPSGYSCPFALKCLSRAVVTNGSAHINDGPHTEFRCFSASQEALIKNVRNLRWHNFNELRHLKCQDDIVDIIVSSMPHNLGVCRIHVSGDFFNQCYFNAWLEVARINPDKLFYTYTKSLAYWVAARIQGILFPTNMVLTASLGGRYDNLATMYGLRTAKVVFSEGEANRLHLPIDHDDSHAANPAERYNDFALLIHGVQPKGSKASRAKSALKGKGSYGKKQ